MIKTLKYIFGFFVLGIVIIFAPVIPVNFDKLGDPKDITDKRVTADISNVDLREIVTVYRGGRFKSLFTSLSSKSSLQFESIKTSNPYKVRHTTNKSTYINPAVGKVVVTIGYYCGPLCGHGTDIYLDKKDGKWYIVRKSSWVS